MKTQELIDKFPNPKERRKYIDFNQLYGLVWDKYFYEPTLCNIYETVLVKDPNIKTIKADKKTILKKENRKLFESKLKEIFGEMHFDVVIGNPPYDRTDIQMKFATMAYLLADKCSSMIIPAKWQCKGDKTKEKLYSTFREMVVPHMSNIKYYIETTDVFWISESAGITYYITDKDKTYENKIISNECRLNENFNNTCERRFIAGKSSLNNLGQSIINKIDISNVIKPTLYSDDVKRYNFYCNALISNNALNTPYGDFINSLLSTKTGKMQVLGQGEINTLEDVNMGLVHDNYNVLFSSDSLDEIKSFLSYAYTKFVRFLIFNSIAGLRSVGQDTWWRFVPNQTFDHIFTDEELYKKYNLTLDDIKVIEATIADRPLSEIYSWINIKE